MTPTGKKIVARAQGNSGVSSSVGIGEKPLNLVLIGQKIVSKEMDDPYVERCGNACAKKMGITPQKVSTGLEFINALEKATLNEELSACVFWGHSWDVGLYLQSENGFYTNGHYGRYSWGTGARKLSHIKSSSIKTKSHSLYIFASCGTAGAGVYDDNSFAVKFADFIDKTKNTSLKEGLSYYKTTVIGATALSNLLQDGTVKTDGSFMKIEKRFEIEKKAIYKDVEEGMLWWKETKKVFERWEVSSKLIDSKLTNLGKKIDPSEIIKNHKPDDTSI